MAALNAIEGTQHQDFNRLEGAVMLVIILGIMVLLVEALLGVPFGFIILQGLIAVIFGIIDYETRFPY